MSDLIDEPEKGSLKKFLRGDAENKKPETDSERIYINRFKDKDVLTKDEVLDQISIWAGAMLIHECRK
jgi:hypothetical protein